MSQPRATISVGAAEHREAVMGYRGKLKEQEQARELRAAGKTLQEIASALNVSRGSVSLWVRDVMYQPRLRLGNGNYGARSRPPNKLARAKQAEIARLIDEGRERIGRLTDREFLLVGLALYAGEGAKRDGNVLFANTDPRLVHLFCVWFRRFFDVDPHRLKVRLYLHEGLDLEGAIDHWSMVTGIPRAQFEKPYRATADASIRKAKHVHGCVGIRYNSTTSHRRIMGMLGALLSSDSFPG